MSAPEKTTLKRDAEGWESVPVPGGGSRPTMVADLLPEDVRVRVEAMKEARAALSSGGGVMSLPAMGGDLSDRVLALVELSSWLVSGQHPHERYATPALPQPTLPDPDLDELDPDRFVSFDSEDFVQAHDFASRLHDARFATVPWAQLPQDRRDAQAAVVQRALRALAAEGRS